MSQGPETRYIKRIHNKLDKRIHTEKTHNVYRGGTADCWYSGPKGDMWIEYKWIDAIPKRKNTAVIPDLSGLQKEWLHDRFAEGRTVCVVVGSPEGGVWFSNPESWEAGLSASQFRFHMLSVQAIAASIESMVL